MVSINAQPMETNEMMNFVKGIFEIFGIVLLRFRLLPRLWGVWLVAVNLACFYFIYHLEAQVVFVVTNIAVLLQAVLYQKMGFTRLLGITHLLWVPMFGWMATRLGSIAEYPDLEMWLAVLFVTNGISFVIDMVDVSRFALGERAPHYRWG